MKTDGDQLIAVQREDLDLDTDPRARALAIADNRVGEIDLEWDLDMLTQLRAEGLDLSAFWTDAVFAALLGEPGTGVTDENAVVEPGPTDIVRGDLFVLGRHQLLCGDATSAGDVTRLLDGVTRVLMTTDPPYGVYRDPAWRHRVNPAQRTAVGRVMHDDRAEWTAAWQLRNSIILNAIEQAQSLWTAERLLGRFAVRKSLHRTTAASMMVLILIVGGAIVDQGALEGQAVPLPADPQVLAMGGQRIRVTPLTGLNQPWALAFLPNGDMLLTERPGRLRLVHDFVLDPQPIEGIPRVLATNFHGLWDVALHPRFAENRWIYFTYSKQNMNETVPPGAQGLQGPSGAAVLVRARYDGGHVLSDVRELFMSNTWISGATAARIVFGRDEKLYMSIGQPSRDRQHGGPNRVGTSEMAQDPSRHAGKILRFNDDGSVPPDNPFVGKAGYKPEIFALGVRNPMALIVHPVTGELMDAEHGPQGGDEVNFIRAGRNYGWPVVSYGRAYSGELSHGGVEKITYLKDSGFSAIPRSGPELAEPCAPGMEQPFLFWVPSMMPGGMAIYTGDKFPAWKGSLFIGGLDSRQLHRVILTNRGLPTGRESLLTELKQRIREVRQGPDGLLYLLTGMDAGAVLKLEPVPEE